MEKPKRPINLFSSFVFLKLDPSFKRLISNEKIAAKQEFENLVGACQEKVFLRTYMLTGLRYDADILFWRVSDDLERLQDICARTSSIGMGKYLLPSYSFIGVYHPEQEAVQKKDLDFGFLPKDTFGRHKFMLFHPVVKSHLWYEISENERQALLAERKTVISRYREIQENFFQSYGMDEIEQIVIREARHLEDLMSATKELRELRIKSYTAIDKPVFLCIGRDLREILDAIS
ncbi:MAG: hypothetical protein A3J79_03080 [Elusimicrobia bacterium RIFOXYB2_FULL_62_6]|nr:MAG: hypothetical protein A3J79_03080 [Elusimicrobia bacterium RIFOXYB2_FULL_62_6]